MHTVGRVLREGWEVRKLGDVCEIYNGSTPLRSKKEYWDNGSVNWFTVNDIRTQGRIIEYTNQKISEEGFKNTSLKLLPINTVLLCCTASVGEFAIAKIELTTNQQFNGLVVKNINTLSSEYLFYFSSTLKEKLLNTSGKTTIDFISMTKLKNFDIPLPPLPEQQKIVAILDEAFGAIERAKANTKRNLTHAKELFESYLQSVFENKCEGWEEKKLGDVCKTGAGGTPLKSHKDYYLDGTIPWLRSGEVDKKNILQCELYITQKGLKNSSAKLFPINSVLIAMYGATAGQVGILRFECSTNQAVCGILPNDNFIPEFIYYKFMAGKDTLVKQAVGGAQPNISQIKIKNTLVPAISIQTQKTIVKKLDTLSEQTKALEKIYQQKINDLDELKKSILQKAFNGELT